LARGEPCSHLHYRSTSRYFYRGDSLTLDFRGLQDKRPMIGGDMSLECRQMRVFPYRIYKFPKAWLIAVLLLAGLQAGFAQQRTGEDSIRLSRQEEEEVTALCNRQHPSLIGDYLVRQDCVVRETRFARERLRATREREERDRRELAARPCVAEALPRIEQTIMRARDALTPNMRLQEIRTTLDQIFTPPGQMGISSHDINIQVYIKEIGFNCDTDFYFNINVDIRRDGNSTRFSVWAYNAPVGYPDGSGAERYIARFARNFVEERAAIERQSRLEAESRARALAEEEQRRQQAEFQRRQTAARAGLRIINREFDCISPSCDLYRYRITLKNETQEIIRFINFGFNLLYTPETRCPSSSTPRIRRATTLGPGETQMYQISQLEYRADGYLQDMPVGRAGSSACATIESVGINP
jgi:hypothetical protein